MADGVRFVLSFGGLLVSLVVAALWLGVRPASRAGRRFLIFVAVAYTLGSIYLIPYGVSRLLVVGYHPVASLDIPRGRIAIVLLNSDNEFAENWSGQRLAYIDRVGAARLWEAYRVYRIVPDAWVIVSEGMPRVGLDVEPSGAAKRDALVHLGVTASRIMIDSGAHDTHDEAVHITPMIRSVHADHVILVTSDTHMRRSLATFRALGVEAIPAIARDPQLAAQWPAWIVPTTRGLAETAEIVHEVLGMVEYTARGWARF